MNTTPLTNEEIKDLLGATLHGPLPHNTMVRVFASLYELVELRGLSKTIQEKKLACTICGNAPDAECHGRLPYNGRNTHKYRGEANEQPHEQGRS